MPSAALVFIILAAATAQFPFGPVTLHSPDGAWQITNVDPVGNEAPHRLVLSSRGGAERLLFSYGRHVRVAWSPDSLHIAITDYSGSTDADCVITDARNLASINVAEQVKRTSGQFAHIMGNQHRYVECLAWTSDREVRVRAHGYGDADPNGATVVTTYRLPK